jgi:nicotinic acid mononucleotide adenylyltransferase
LKKIYLYGGGFKIPHIGHFNVVKQTLEEVPDIDKFIIYVGAKERGGITQEQSMGVWEIYKPYLSNKIKIVASTAPIGSMVRFVKNNKELNEIGFVLGEREGVEEDKNNSTSRVKSVYNKYPNLKTHIIKTTNQNISGTNTRICIMDKNYIELKKYLPTISNGDLKRLISIIK